MSGREGQAPAWLDALAADRGFRVQLPGGEEIGATAPRFTVAIRSPKLMRSLRVLPTPLALGRAWIDGDLDIDGDIFAAMETMHDLDTAMPGPAMRFLGFVRAFGRPWRNAPRDIAAHYDVPSEFYELFLGPGMVYTCAYYCGVDTDLDQAQRDKLDLVCRKLRLAPGQSLLDLGCGWGGLACWAAANYGVDVHGVTLSRSQAEWAAAAAERAGLSDRVRIQHLDYRALPLDRRYDRIASLGMIEHLGRASYAGYFGRVHALLADDGLFLNHGVTAARAGAWSSEMEFLDRYVFPGLEMVEVSTTLAAMENAALEIVDVENLRPHYARTTRDWVERLWCKRDAAVAIAGERTWRTWVGYMAAASVSFARGWIGLHQVVARRALAGDDGRLPHLRETIYR